MILDVSLKVKNYKCFDSELQGFEKIYPINILIGRNNVGKSSLLDLLNATSSGIGDFLFSGRGQVNTSIAMTHVFTTEELGRIFPQTIMHPAHFKEVENKRCEILVTHGEMKINWGFEINKVLNNHLIQLKNNIPLRKSRYRHISADRDIIPETKDEGGKVTNGIGQVKISSNGDGVTRMLQAVLVNEDYRHILKTAKIELLAELNKILNPDIVLDDIHIQETSNDHSLWELSFRSNDEFIKLSKMGSGIKTILFVLVNLIVIPKVEATIRRDYIFGFEELENNLHPSLLRRLLNYIVEYVEKHKNYLFITTHSSTVIDLFSGNENAQIVHVTSDGKKSTCTTISTFLDGKSILKDLGIRASDILQSNGIIWVEGPSDRIFLNKWLSLVSDFKEGYHYSIMFYGGRLLSNLTLQEDWLEKEIVPLLKINSNAFVLMDRDGNTADTRLNDTKQRIRQEVGDKNSWVTKGREVENYITKNTIERWLLNSYASKVTVQIASDSKFEDLVSGASDEITIKYGKNKKGFSSEIVEYMGVEDIDYLDLAEKLDALKAIIADWNHIEL